MGKMILVEKMVDVVLYDLDRVRKSLAMLWLKLETTESGFT
jgi:hypothetical protein